MVPFFVLVVCFAGNQGTSCLVWSEDTKTYARYETAAACEAQVKKVEAAIEAEEKKTHTKAPPYVMGCKEVELVKEGNRLDANHT